MNRYWIKWSRGYVWSPFSSSFFLEKAVSYLMAAVEWKVLSPKQSGTEVYVGERIWKGSMLIEPRLKWVNTSEYHWGYEESIF